MALTRRQLVERTALAAAAAGGVYELADRLTPAPRRARAAAGAAAEQHLIDLSVVTEDGVEVLVPPLHHAVVTARVRVDQDPKALREAQRELERVLGSLDRDYRPGPAGLSVTVAWGLPYFGRYVAAAADSHLPIDLRASRDRRRPVGSLLDARRFPSDPDDVVLEQNDVAVLLRGDDRAAVSDGVARLLRGARDLLEPTSIRRGFVGGGLPRRLALAAGVRGAERVPEHAQLFLGFTSTQRHAMGPARIANLETLGYTTRNEYFAGGTHLHLSHMDEDLERWYGQFTFRERVWTAFNPGLDVADGTRAVKQDHGTTPATVAHQYHRTGVLGHSGALQTASRLVRDHVGPDGTVYRRGTAVPQRADFNTLDNPFAWSADPARDRMRAAPTAGVHFVAFHPTSDDFHRVRLAMDGVLPDGTHLPFEPHDRAQGFNAVLRTTHRQNFIVPPRRHRSFPLAELG
jgi:hypothetical protein